MYSSSFRSSVVLLCCSALVSSHPTPLLLPLLDDLHLLNNQYAPVQTSCPEGQLVRSADGLSVDEANYMNSRRPKANKSLASWLGVHGNFTNDNLPSLALTASGGGYRALLLAAGVVQAFDERDGDHATSGLFQSLTYQAGLSGGAWFLGSFAGNDYPTVSHLSETLWSPSFQSSLLLPDHLLDTTQYIEIGLDVVSKVTAGFASTIVDAWGRLLSYQFFHQDGGEDIRMATIASMSNFTAFNVPYPIITALGVDQSYLSECFADEHATQYEFHPYEYGSWDAGVQAFARTQYMGSDLTNGSPTQSDKCITNYDNLGYVFGTSSNIFSAVCAPLQPLTYEFGPLTNILKALAGLTQAPTFVDLLGVFPNPFYKLPQSTAVNEHKLLTMQDGGSGGRNIPIWPFIQPARDVDVLITCDNGANIDNFSNGTDLRQTYLLAQAASLTKMPYIPDPSEYVAKGLDRRATFFGCDSADTILIINLPNVNYTYPSNQNGLRIQYGASDTLGMLDNGAQIALQNGAKDWPFCLACGIKYRDGIANLPSGCDVCLQKYCYNDQ